MNTTSSTRHAWPWATAGVTAVIIGLLLIPGDDLPKVGVQGIDLVVHVTLYCAWGLALQWEFPRLPWWAVLALGAGLGLLTETLQLFAVHRSFSGTDIAADVAGVALALLLARLLEAARRAG